MLTLSHPFAENPQYLHEPCLVEALACFDCGSFVRFESVWPVWRLGGFGDLRAAPLTLLDGYVETGCAGCARVEGSGYRLLEDLRANLVLHADCDVFRYLADRKIWVPVRSEEARWFRIPSPPGRGLG